MDIISTYCIVCEIMIVPYMFAEMGKKEFFEFWSFSDWIEIPIQILVLIIIAPLAIPVLIFDLIRSLIEKLKSSSHG